MRENYCGYHRSIHSSIMSMCVLIIVLQYVTYVHNFNAKTRGSKEARLGQYPFVSFISYTRDDRIFNWIGALVSPSKVITSTYHFQNGSTDPGKCTVSVGYTDTAEKSISQEQVAIKIVLHEEHNKLNNMHDVAVVFVGEPFEMNMFIEIVYISKDKLQEPTKCTNFGIDPKGDNSSESILVYEDDITVSPPPGECERTTLDGFYCHKIKQTEGCAGDVGSPLICNNMVYGVLSYREFGKENFIHCGNVTEAVYTDLSAEEDFLGRVEIETKWTEVGMPEKFTTRTNPSPKIQYTSKSPGLLGNPKTVILAVSSHILIVVCLLVQ